MPNTGDFDPAEAIDFNQDKARQRVRQQRAAEEAEKQRVQAQEDSRRASVRKLLLYADEQLEDIRNPIVSEFVIGERWWAVERISDPRDRRAFEVKLQSDPDQRLISTEDPGFFSNRYKHAVAQRQYRVLARYYGSWLSLSNTSGAYESIKGLVKLRQPRAGYAFASIQNDWDPRNVGNIFIDVNDLVSAGSHSRVSWRIASKNLGRNYVDQHFRIHFRIFESLEEAAEGECNNVSVESLTKQVTQALDFVATGQPPEPKLIYSDGPDYS
ncbi:MAG: hypothetical protein ACREXR_10510 [Gammaproteobacteria bacterium]